MNLEKELMKLYNEIDLNDKKNEFSALLIKINGVLNAMLENYDLSNIKEIKNYDKYKDDKLTESEIFTFFYEDLWKIKNKLLILYSLKKNTK